MIFKELCDNIKSIYPNAQFENDGFYIEVFHNKEEMSSLEVYGYDTGDIMMICTTDNNMSSIKLHDKSFEQMIDLVKGLK